MCVNAILCSCGALMEGNGTPLEGTVCQVLKHAVTSCKFCCSTGALHPQKQLAHRAVEVTAQVVQLTEPQLLTRSRTLKSSLNLINPPN